VEEENEHRFQTASRSNQDPNTDPAKQNLASAAMQLRALEWRLIGPHRGGRVVAVAGDPSQPQVFYFGSTGGGVWKTTDGGLYWENVSDGFFKRASVGAIAVAPSDPNVIYVGMGETCIRNNVSHGDGVYKSTDGGKTWIHLGLADTRHIAKVRIHPQNPDLVYVAALGHAHGPNAERGVYRSRDGGKSWEQILFRSEDAGAIDLVIDPHNPRILYAAFWEARRLPHTLISGGTGSGLFKSTDSGDTWIEITHKPGLPAGILGKIGIAASPAKVDRVWAIIEAEDGAVFRSDDSGETWQRLCEERTLRQRAWYYHHIYADPCDPETLWVLNVQAWKSVDGGHTFFEVAIPHGDHHDLWIDPHDPQRMIEGNDGGACVTFNGGESWSTQYNQPTAEFYHVTTDNQIPYRVYGAQQDNTTISVPSRSNYAAITPLDWLEPGGGESGYIAVHPEHPDIIYAGNYQGYLTRYFLPTGQRRNIAVWPEPASGWGAKDQKYRFQWTFPIILSPHDPNTLYVTGNHVFRSTDEGSSWEIISPDLTRNDVTRMEPSGGLITQDNTGAEYYGTIFTFAESPITRGLFWAGSDDGLIHLSPDGGKTWKDVTPADLPKWALVSIIEPSPHDPATAYIAATCYRFDDFRPYLFKTHDYGKTWTKIAAGIREADFTRVIRADPERQGLLYAGTETGIYVSFDDGEHWQSLQLNLPVVPIHDLVVKGSDLVVATHGRSFWILDDITPLRQINNEILNASAYLFKPRPTIRFMTQRGFPHTSIPGKNYRMAGPLAVTYRQKEKPTGEKVDIYLDAGQNPPDGVIVYYYLKEQPEGEVTLTFLDAEGQEIKSFSSAIKKEEEKSSSTGDSPAAQADERREPRIAKEAGLNRFVWNMRYEDARKVDGYVTPTGTLPGPVAAPGTYQVRLTVGNETATKWFEIHKDPRMPVTDEDLRAQFALLLKIRDKVSEAHDAINTLRSIRQQVAEWERRTQGWENSAAITDAARSLKEKLTPIEEELIQVRAKNRGDTLNFPIKLNAKLAGLSSVVASADAAPTKQAYEVFNDLSARIDEQIRRLQVIIAKDVAAFNVLIRDTGMPAIIPRATLPEGH
jgi:photosystem II stability/assembly factor-like uncharacterized protein